MNTNPNAHSSFFKLWLTNLLLLAGISVGFNQSNHITLFTLSFGENKEHVLFSTWKENLPPQKTDQEAPFLSPMLRVSKDGKVIGLCYQSNDNGEQSPIIRLFSLQGKRIGSLGLSSKGIKGFVLSSTHVVAWDGRKLYVFDFEGTTQEIWAQEYNQTLERAKAAGIKFYNLLTIDCTNTLYFQASSDGEIKTVALKRSGQYELFDSDGPVQYGTANRFDISPLRTSDERAIQSYFHLDGSVLSTVDVPRFDKRNVQVFDSSNALTFTYEIPDGSLLDEERTLTFSLSPDRVSDFGHLFIVAESLSSRLERVGNHFLRTTYHVLAYNSQGKRLNLGVPLKVPSSNSYHDTLDYLWDIDREGNLYYLDFQADHLKVMKVPAR